MGMLLQIQPLRGGLRAIVPAPIGIRAVGEGAVGDLDRLDEGVLLPVGVLLPELGGDEDVGLVGVGEIGFILNPLIPRAATALGGGGAG